MSDHVPFDELQGTTIEGVPAWSNGSDMFFSATRSYDGEIFTGFKWQCVEFARRWLLERKGILLPEVARACMIYLITEMERVSDGEKVKVTTVRNGGPRKPEPGLLIWPASEENWVGHVAAITEVGDGFVCIADQNHSFAKWTGHHRARLEVKEADGHYTVFDVDGTKPLGWLTFSDIPDRDRSQPLTFAAKYKRPVPEPMTLERIKFVPQDPKDNWLDLTNPAEKKFVETFGMDVSRTRLEEAEANYYKANWELALGCIRAGVDLHRMFLAATERVLGNDDYLRKFGIEERFWPKIRHSWATEKCCITGRFDFAFRDNEIKCFEYNADSASTLLECGRIQQKWAESVGISEGSMSSGFRIMSLLKHAWKEAHVVGRLHLLIDDDDEEEYTALTIAEGAAANGTDTRVCKMFDEFTWKGGVIVDRDGVQVKTVWKTWMWESAITDLHKAEHERPKNWKPKDGDKVRLCDLMLGDTGIRVLEPMWKLIPSNKAILPHLFEMFPDHPNVLPTTWTLTPELQKSGYVKKPIVGRVGRNVTVCSGSGELLKQSEGNFGDRDMIYQQLFELPKRHDYYAILGGWIIGNGYYGGTGIREDKTIITGVESPFSALRVVFPADITTPIMVTQEYIDKRDAELAAAASVANKA